MGIKKDMMMAVVTGFIGIALVSGGTVAYFTAELTTENQFQSGILELDISDVDDGVLFEFDHIKPGDVLEHRFSITNAGTLDMEKITLFSEHTTYNRDGKEDDNGFAKQILVNTIKVGEEAVLEHPLSLEEMKEEDIVLAELLRADSEPLDVYAEFEFIMTKENQNEYQGNTLELYWTFEAVQTVNE